MSLPNVRPRPPRQVRRFAPCPFTLDGSAITPTTMGLLRSSTHGLPDRIATRIQREVPSYAGPSFGRRRIVVREAIEAAVADFIALLGHDVSDHDAVDRLFRDMAASEAQRTRPVTDLLSALRLAKSDLWAEMSRVTVRHDLSGPTVSGMGCLIDSYVSHLWQQVERGHGVGQARDPDPRHRLLGALLRGDSEGATALASRAGWPLPRRLVVMAASGTGRPRTGRLPPAALVGWHEFQVFVVVGEDDAAAIKRSVLRLHCVPVAVTWPVEPRRVGDAARWASRALDLHRCGRIAADGPWLDCAEHRLALLIEADEVLGEQLTRDVLAPLAALTPHKRHVLAETLHRHLVARESAPEMAIHLGTHPQTVRYRLRQLREYFGASLDDPDHRLGLILALESALPEWRQERRAAGASGVRGQER